MKSTPPIDIIREINTGVYCGGASGRICWYKYTDNWELYQNKSNKYQDNKYKMSDKYKSKLVISPLVVLSWGV